MLDKLRVEISFKDLYQLKKKIEFCINNDLYKINIPCKGLIKKDFLFEAARFLGNNYKDINITYHYSFYYQYYKNSSLSYEKFLNFIDLIDSYDKNNILLVSGSKKRNEFEVLNILDKLKSDLGSFSKFGVAYNPYYQDDNDLENERNRLIYKLKSGLINSIWLQFGSELNNLEREISFIKKLKNDFSRNINLYGSLFIPSKQFLARFKFRPWRGVFLSDEYLNSLERSKLITKKIINIYKYNKVIPLIESECTTDKQLIEARKFIKI